MGVSENSIIELLHGQVLSNQDLSFSFLDDCARIPEAAGTLLVSTDSLAEDVHFRRARISPEDLGWKSLAVNLSDMAAKGATPVGFFLTWNLPTDISETWLRDFLRGLDACARAYACPLLGGDTTGSASSLSIHITILGRALTPAYRMNGQEGDVLAVSGELGASALGLAIQEGELSGNHGILPEEIGLALRAHHRPLPRLAEGRWLCEQGAHAMMDLSDGVFRDTVKLAKASELTFEVDVLSLPVSIVLRDLQQREVLSIDESKAFALLGGEDYELLVALPERQSQRICREFVESFDRPLSVIGRLGKKVTPAEIPCPGGSEANDLRAWKNLIKVSPRFRTLAFEHFSRV